MKRQEAIMVLLMCFFTTQYIFAQASHTNEGPRQYIKQVEEKPKLTFFQGFTISGDVLGPIQHFMSDYGNIEGAIRLNLKNTYFPIIELGLSSCEITDANTDIKYSTTAPFGRIGLDYNLLKNKFQENRLFVGLRYGISKYKYDYSGPDISDPIWDGSKYNLNINNVDATSHWGELVLGVQVKIWRNFHMGWSVRLKKAFSTTSNLSSKPYYIPGYGKNSSGTSWGGTYSLIFDVNWGKKKWKTTAPVSPHTQQNDNNSNNKESGKENIENIENIENTDNTDNKNDKKQ